MCRLILTDLFAFFSIKPNTLNLIEESVGNSLEHIGTGDKFLIRTPITQVLRLTSNKWDPKKQKASVRQRTLSIGQNGSPENVKMFSPTSHLTEG